MKTTRTFRFVLTSVNNAALAAGECTTLNTCITGERLFASECHYYAEKNIIECVKGADKSNYVSDYYGYTYLIYKEMKPRTETIEREEDGKKITETIEIPGSAMLVETITVDKDGIHIQ